MVLKPPQHVLSECLLCIGASSASTTIFCCNQSRASGLVGSVLPSLSGFQRYPSPPSSIGSGRMLPSLCPRCLVLLSQIAGHCFPPFAKHFGSNLRFLDIHLLKVRLLQIIVASFLENGTSVLSITSIN